MNSLNTPKMIAVNYHPATTIDEILTEGYLSIFEDKWENRWLVQSNRCDDGLFIVSAVSSDNEAENWLSSWECLSEAKQIEILDYMGMDSFDPDLADPMHQIRLVDLLLNAGPGYIFSGSYAPMVCNSLDEVKEYIHQGDKPE